MRYASFFSGVGGFDLALDAAGHERVFSCEINAFCTRVQEARYGRRPDWADISTLEPSSIPDADLWSAGWPCQGLSIAGKRKGLADDRSGLFWELVRLLESKRPPWILLENVPGLLSSCSCPRCRDEGMRCRDCGAEAADDEACCECGSENVGGRVLPGHRGSDFFVVLTALQGVGYGVQTRILDAQFFGVPQRRHRVYFVGCIGAPCRPQILFEPASGFGDPAPGLGERPDDPGADQSNPRGHRRQVARPVVGVGGGQDYAAGKGTLVAGTIQSCGEGQGRRTPEVDHLIAAPITASSGHHGHSSPRGDGSDNIVAHALNVGGRFDPNGEDFVLYENHGQDSRLREVPVCPSISAKAGTGAQNLPLVTGSLRTNALNNSDPTMEVNALVIQDVRGARDKKQNGMGITSGPAYTVDGTSRHGVAFEPRYFTRAVGPPPSEVSSTLKADSGRSPKSDASPLAVQATTVRRLTPTETERLQGFPDGFSCLCAVRPDCPDRRIPPWLDPRTFTLGGCGHSACGCKCPDSPRYKAMGNAVAVPVVRWIVDRLTGHMKEGS